MPHERKILVTSALPYANGPIHLGHLVEHIQTDIWVRYQRLRGRHCTYLCADDTHGTAIMLKAEQEGVSPEQLIERVGQEHVRDFAAFGIVFDYFGSTHSPQNQQLAEDFYRRIEKTGHITRRTIEQAYDPIKNLFLPDRFIKGTCPRCAAPDQYGDSCEACGATYAPADLKDAVSVLSGARPITKSSEHYFFKLADFAPSLEAYSHTGALQEEASHTLSEWFQQGLTDWDISRDAPYFGFPIPGAPDKYFYVWVDAPVGYIATFWQLCNQHTNTALTLDEIRQQWSDCDIHHFIGKDILYFHTLFWPAMLEAAGLQKPKGIHIHGFLTVNGKKMSKSRGTFITAQQYLAHLDPEYLRYYFAAKLNKNIEDIDLNWNDFRARINSDLVGKLVNIASRTSQLLARHLNNKLGSNLPEPKLFAEFIAAAETIGNFYETREYSRAIREIMELADRANRYVDDTKPWELARDASQHTKLQDVCTQTLNLFRILIAYLKPVLPHTTQAAEAFLQDPHLNFERVRTPLINHTIGTYNHLLKRVEPDALKSLYESPPAITATTPISTPATTVPEGTCTLISLDDFTKIDLRIARVIAADYVEGADKLLQLTLDLNEGKTRTVFAGIRHAYTPEQLIGRLVVCVANLSPRKMRFGISEGMVLAAAEGTRLFLASADDGAEPGMRLR